MFFRRKNDKGYVSADTYEKELERIDEEIRSINKTIKFYEGKRKVLEEWKGLVKLSIKQEYREEICCNCKHFTHPSFCMLYESAVDKKATCNDFVWSV